MKSISIQTRDGRATSYAVSDTTTHVIITRSLNGRASFTPVSSKNLIPKLTKFAAAGRDPIAYPVVHGKVTEDA